jgi:hypothetical protein
MFLRFRPAHSVVALVAVTCAAALFGGAAYAGRGHQTLAADPACSINPTPAAVDQAYTVSAIGLPTTSPVWLIVKAPSGQSNVSQVDVNSDGTWSGAKTSSQVGTWTYTFSGEIASNKNMYGVVATCSAQVS